MKKYILPLLFIVLTIASAFAVTYKLDPGIFWKSVPVTAADTSVSGVLVQKAVLVNKSTPLYYNIGIGVQEVTAGSADIILQGKVFDYEPYTAIDTVAATVTDTLYLNQNTTQSHYRYFNVVLKAGTGKWKLLNLDEFYKSE